MSKWINRLIVLLWAGFIIGGCSFTALIFMVRNNSFDYFGGLPGIEFIEDPNTELASELYSADGVILGKYFRKNRTNVEYEDLGDNLINTLKATEDIRFEDHSGIDLRAMLRVFKGIVSGNLSGGGSTITQQLAKNIFRMRAASEYRGPAYDNKLMRKVTIKVKEWIIAARLERSYTKREIMTMYFNTVEFSRQAFGIKVSSKAFFGTAPADLELEESAVLVGMLKAPGDNDPIVHPEASKIRRNVVLSQLYKYDFITEEQKDSLQALPLDMTRYGVENHVGGVAPYFRTEVRNQLMRWCKKNGYDLFSDGLKIYTTIDTKLQVKAEDAVKKHMKILQKRFWEHWDGKEPWRDEDGNLMEDTPMRAMKRTGTYKKLKARFGDNQDSINYYINIKKPMTLFSWNGDFDSTCSSLDSVKYYMHFLHTGMAAMDPTNGHLKAWVGGINYKYFQYDHVNTGTRQPGSTFKPFIYLAAIDNGMSPCDSILDDIVTFTVDVEKDGEIVPEAWAPQNFDKVYTQRNYTLRHGLAESKNVIAAKIMQRIGEGTAVSYARKLGLTTELPAVPALCLGTGEARLVEMISAYSTFVNNGFHNSPIFITKIEDKNGNVVASYKNFPKQVISKESAQTMLYMLQGATSWEYKDPKSNQGTGTAIRLRTGNMHELGGERWEFRNEIGAKTGTTSNNSDGWFMGVTNNLVVGVWVGADNRNVHFKTGKYGQGSRMAMPIFGHFMKEVYADTTNGIDPVNFPEEVKLVGEKACKGGKKLASDSTEVEEPVLLNEEEEDTGEGDI